MEAESKDYSWKWVTADELLSHGACELVYAQAVSDGGEIKDTILYDGEDTTGKLLINLQQGLKGNVTFAPKEPVYCRRGLYVNIGSSAEGVFIQWRELPQGIGY